MLSASARTVIVVRFKPFGIESIVNSVKKQVIGDEIKGRPARHGVSVFADVQRATESVEETVHRICTVASAHAGGPKIAVTTEEALNARGYCLHETFPPELHYLIGGESIFTPPPELDGLADEWTKDRRDNPVFEKEQTS
ncbi:hypothetical protein [Microbacterium sp. Clip185]|uniref:hypothetical protein n=1 Tax=Microbacterium sp. Clip185 TaxID=3025663 RepID=UPI00236526E9|nr:hypothetical protein [Microbacterium sp. Clip185]WDG17487.1 hypothetical protein PQV94_12775 [Microbacterium sp. Clip185]